MPYSDPNTIQDETVAVLNPSVGSASGSKTYLPVRTRGKLMAVGFHPHSLVTSAITMAVSVGDNSSNLASNFTQVITSTLGSFSSTLTVEGARLEVIPPSDIYVKEGDCLQITTSGGQSSLVAGTVYAVIRRK